MCMAECMDNGCIRGSLLACLCTQGQKEKFSGFFNSIIFAKKELILTMHTVIHARSYPGMQPCTRKCKQTSSYANVHTRACTAAWFEVYVNEAKVL